MSFPRYPKYKDSGVTWLGEIPTHWRQKRGKYLFDRMQRPVLDDDEIVTAFRDGEVTLRKNRRQDGFTIAAKEHGYQGVRKGDLVIHAMDAFAGAIGVSDADGKCSPVYSCCTPKPFVSPVFYAYLLRAMSKFGFIESLAKGVRERSTDFRWVDFSELRLPLPDAKEQQKIVDFLDRETAKIDALIEEQQRLIELLEEKRQAVISHAVTKGLDSDVPMKDSGVEWLGEVPAHWTTASLKYALDAIADVDHYMPESVESGIPYVMTGDLRSTASGIDLNNCKKISRDDFLKLTKNTRIAKGDVIMARYATIGTVSYVNIDAEFVVSYSCVTIKPRPGFAIGRFLFFYFQSDAFIQGISNKVNANTQSNVGIADLRGG